VISPGSQRVCSCGLGGHRCRGLVELLGLLRGRACRRHASRSDGRGLGRRTRSGSAGWLERQLRSRRHHGVFERATPVRRTRAGPQDGRLVGGRRLIDARRGRGVELARRRNHCLRRSRRGHCRFARSRSSDRLVQYRSTDRLGGYGRRSRRRRSDRHLARHRSCCARLARRRRLDGRNLYDRIGRRGADRRWLDGSLTHGHCTVGFWC